MAQVMKKDFKNLSKLYCYGLRIRYVAHGIRNVGFVIK